jgi:methylated-DNA-[protein]-cysteine S-methyltransferase
MTFALGTHASPLGDITFAVHEGCLYALDFAERWPRAWARLARRYPGAESRRDPQAGGVAARLHAYFAGELDALAPIPVDPGGTPFQQRVWAALRRLQPGRPVAYRDLARMIGKPAAVRAVGAANGANPIGIVIPCHRVIGADGRLTGYAGGMERKRWLLAHEASKLTQESFAI